MTYPSGQTNSGPPRRFAGGGGGGAAPLSMEGAALYNILWVDKTSMAYVADGSVQLPFNTIVAALAYAATLAPTASNPVAVVVMPGVYDEQVTLATDYVYLFGWDRDTTIITNVLQVLTVNTQYTSVVNLTIRTTAPGVIRVVNVATLAGAWTAAAQFVDCKIDVTQNCLFFIDANTRAIVRRCVFVSAGGTQLIRCDGLQCDFYDCTTPLRSQVGAAATARFTRCTFAGIIAFAAGSTLEVYDSYSNSGGFEAVSFSAAVPTALVLRGNRFVSTATYDISCAVACSGTIIENNILSKGISPNVSHVNPIKYVGAAGNKDFYATTQDALTACTFDDCTVKLLKDETVAAALAPPARPVRIDGNGKHRITRAAGSAIVTVGASATLTLYDLELVGSVDVNGNAAVAYLEQCLLTGMVDIVAGDASSAVYIIGSKVLGDASDLYAVRIRDADPTIVIKRASQVKGATGGGGSPAIYYDTVTNNNLKTEHSTIVHGGLAANDPFGRSAAQTPNYRDHHSAFNTTPGAGWATNLIAPAQRFETVDPNIDF